MTNTDITPEELEAAVKAYLNERQRSRHASIASAMKAAITAFLEVRGSSDQLIRNILISDIEQMREAKKGQGEG